MHNFYHWCEVIHDSAIQIAHKYVLKTTGEQESTEEIIIFHRK